MKYSPSTAHISLARMGIIVVCNYEDNVRRDYQRSKGEDKKAADEEGAGTRRKGSRGWREEGRDYPFSLFVELSFSLPSFSSRLPPPLFPLSLY